MSKFMRQEPIILASSSQPRKKLLHSLGLEFTCIAAEIDEETFKQRYGTEDFNVLALQLSAAKAQAVSAQHPEDFVIGADQLCVCEQRIFDKPITHARARAQLAQLQGMAHQQICGMSIAHRGEILWQAVDIVRLWMRPLDIHAIEHYLQREQPYHSCGSYHFEGLGKWLFKRIEGSDSSVQGLALTPLIEGLLQCGAVEFP